MNEKARLESLMSKIERSPTECDGFARLASYLLIENNIPHQVICGSYTDNSGRSIPLHFWVETERYIIDYRAKMWLVDDAPHGIIEKSQVKGYQGKQVNLPNINKTLFNILCESFY